MQPDSVNHLSQLLAGEAKPPAEFTEYALDNWIRRLPLADVGSSSVAVYSLLRTVNMIDKLSCDERIRIIEHIRPVALSLVDTASEKYLSAETLFPLSVDHRRHVQHIVDVCLELVGAYRRIMTSGTFFSDKVMGDNLRALVIYRALQACDQALLCSLESYESPPRGYWWEVYAFYHFAEGHHLQYLRLPTNESENPTIDNQFKQILLLALSSHQRHRPDEIRHFNSALMLIAKDAVIGNESSQADETALFYFDIGSDHAPHFVKKARKFTGGDRRFLFTVQMANKVRQPSTNPVCRIQEKSKLKPDEFLRLLDTLSSTEKRRYARKPDSGLCKFVIGFPHLLIAYCEEAFLPVEDKTEPEPTNTQQVEVVEVENVIIHYPMPAESDIWHQSDSGYTTVTPNKKIIDSISDDLLDSKSFKLGGWFLNSSAMGCCMLWLNRQVSAARVGELIGLYQDKCLQLGVIRWLHQNSNLELAVGVDLLAPVVEVVSIESGSSGEPEQAGLYWQGNEKLGQPASLLAEPGLYKPKQTIILRHNHTRVAYHLEMLLEETLAFQLFKLVPLDEGFSR